MSKPYNQVKQIHFSHGLTIGKGNWHKISYISYRLANIKQTQ